MKLKYYLRGMGIGILVSTVLLMIACSLHKNDTLTDDEIRARAAALGMVSAGETAATDKLSDPKTDESEDAPEEGEAADTTESSENETDATLSDQAAYDAEESEKDDSKQDDAKQVETVEQVTFSIVAGEYSDTVCKKLKRAGIIDNAKDFNKYLAAGGYDSLILPGTYTIEKGADYDTIVQIITGSNEE